jgi:hypothetical protein
VVSAYPQLAEASEAWYWIARTYATQAGTYRPGGDSATQFSYRNALKICRNVLEQKDSSTGKSLCKELLQSILRTELSLQAENVNIPGPPFRLLVSYRNLPLIHIRILPVPMDLDKLANESGQGTSFWEETTKKEPVKTITQNLPDPGDHQPHAVELRVDSLPPGSYAVLASEDANFSLGENRMSYSTFHVSAISFVNNGPDYFVLDRETGRPLERTDVQLWYRYMDKTSGRWRYRMGEHMITDRNGFFTVPPAKTQSNQQFLMEFTRKGDHLMTGTQYTYLNYSYGGEDLNQQIRDETKTGFEKRQRSTFLFTDRAAYRPGQVVYFKGIAVTKDFDTQASKLVAGLAARIFLVDANGTKIDSINLVTSSFGSFTGKFIIPAHHLRGMFSIREDSTKSIHTFSVEEYKRPRFLVRFNKPSGNIYLGDSVSITGQIKGYAGNFINGARVIYRVSRRALMPFIRPGNISTSRFIQEAVLSHGTVTTGETGNFLIKFSARPGTPDDRNAAFDFIIRTDVSDLTGENISDQTSILISHSGIKIVFDTPPGFRISADSLRQVTIRTENLSGEPVPAKVEVDVFRLKEPDHLIRPRFWNAPDQFVMNRQEYAAYFPYDEYSHETDRGTWPRSEQPIRLADSSMLMQPLRLENVRLGPGWYLIRASAKDSSGHKSSDSVYIHIIDPKSAMQGGPVYFWASNETMTVQPGALAHLSIGSSLKDQFIIQQTDRKMAEELGRRLVRNIKYDFITLSQGKTNFEYLVAENDRGGFGTYFVMVRHNRVFTEGTAIEVPWDNKELKVNLESFRVKTRPGSPEKWRIRVRRPKGDSSATELLTSMYDVSLDQIHPNIWAIPTIFPPYTFLNNWQTEDNFRSVYTFSNPFPYNEIPSFLFTFDRIIKDSPPMSAILGYASQGAPGAVSRASLRPAMTTLPDSGTGDQSGEKQTAAVPILRRDFRETAFIMPELTTDSAGAAEFSFTMPESLTEWKWMTLAHNKNLAFAYAEARIQSQKDLMIQANAPRFFRAGDKIDFSTRIINQTDSELRGQAHLQLKDPSTDQPVDGWFQNMEANQFFTVPPRQQVGIRFSLQIPYQYDRPVACQVTAEASSRGLQEGVGDTTDGEETIIPVLSNQHLVTEAVPLNMPGNGTMRLSFDRLLKSGESQTLRHHSLTAEFSTNPSWYALQALPSLSEPLPDCSEQLFECLYAGALADMMRRNIPAIREWLSKRESQAPSHSLDSALRSNESLKSDLFQETPWVTEAKSEEIRINSLASFLDSNRMQRQIRSCLLGLRNLQSPTGGFPWFNGGPDDRFITQSILAGLGRLHRLGSFGEAGPMILHNLNLQILKFLDNQIKDDYRAAEKNALGPKNLHQIRPLQVQYLYARSYFIEPRPAPEVDAAIEYFIREARRNWPQEEKQLQAMTALALYRMGDKKTARDIIASLHESAIMDAGNSMHWNTGNSGYYWYQAAIQTQTLIMEAFQEIEGDPKSLDKMKTWLLMQKQTQHWGSGKATADAVYALLIQGSHWMENKPEITLLLGDKTISSTGQNTEPGTGSFSTTIDGPFVHADMGHIAVTTKSQNHEKQVSQPVWGSLYWQYFEDLDKVGAGAGTCRLTKSMALVKNSDRGPVLVPVSDNQTLIPGSKIMVRIAIQNDRDLQYVQLKDMRAGGMEPTSTSSGWRWQEGLGYYQSSGDLSTDFYFPILPKGHFLFEYPLFVTQTGNFGVGFANLQCLYAPQVTCHSEGIRINSENSEP